MYITHVKKKYYSKVLKQVGALSSEMPKLPEADEHYKIFSYGGFSSIAFITRIAMDEGISRLTASTLRIGVKEMQAMIDLHMAGKLNKAVFFVGSIFLNDKHREYDYYTQAHDFCMSAGWDFHVIKTHSKVLLFETMQGRKYVVETSSNLNENPKTEQFCIEQDAGAYDFYRACLYAGREQAIGARKVSRVADRRGAAPDRGMG